MLVNCLARLRVLRSQATAAATANNEAQLQQPPPLRVVSCIRTTHTYLAAADIARRSTASGDLMAVDLITTSQLTGGYMTQVKRHHAMVILVMRTSRRASTEEISVVVVVVIVMLLVMVMVMVIVLVMVWLSWLWLWQVYGDGYGDCHGDGYGVMAGIW